MKTCSVCGVEKTMSEFQKGKGKCKPCLAEYQREFYARRRRGELPTKPCKVKGCTRIMFSLNLCHMHYNRQRRDGDLGEAGMKIAAKGSDDVNYKSVHARIYREKGSASDYDCVNCGAPALHWALQHDKCDDADLLICGDLDGLLYIMDTSKYAPMCGTCHNLLDKDVKGEKNPMSKLTEEDVRYILRSTGKSQRELGEMFSVTQTSISHIMLGKTWKHVSAELGVTK